MLSTACPKPARGTARAAREAKRAALVAHEKREKAAVVARDGNRCRWPDCRETTRLECAHIVAKGMGGDHGIRSRRENMMRLCEAMHRGPHSLHSGDRRVECLTSRGTDGPCRFWVTTESGWTVVGCEVAP